MKIEILSANKKIYEGESRAVTLPAKEGELQILDGHAPLFTLLDIGEIILEKGKKFSVSSGIAEFIDNKATILIKGL
jgi:F-type H+-transporting ATPase subunit epsilon